MFDSDSSYDVTPKPTTEPMTNATTDSTTRGTTVPTTQDRCHTLASIAKQAATTKRTAQRWLTKATKAECGEIGKMIGDVRHFSDAERDILLSYQSRKAAPKPKPKSAPVIEPDEVIEPGALATFDPFAGINLATPAQEIRFESRDTSELSTQMSAETMAMIEAGKAFNAGIINAAMASASDLGTQLGTAQAQQIIMQAENQKNEVLAQYLASQGASAKKQEDGSSPQSA